MVARDLPALAASGFRPLTRVEYDKLVAMGCFEGEKVELLEGVLVTMSASGPRHAATIQRLSRLIYAALLGRAELRVQMPFAASPHAEPEPDVAVVAPGNYDDDHPAAAHLLVEVADSSLDRDRDAKALIYARAGVADYWGVNLEDGVVEVRREPTARGYLSVTPFRRGQRVALLAFADVSIAVDDVLPPPR